MHSKLAGHLPLQEMIAQTLESARSKLAAAEEVVGKEKKEFPFKKKTEGKAHEKAESAKEEKEEHEDHEKMSSVLDASDPDDMSKLASALDELGDELLKEADSIENGGEAKQGGEQLATMSPVGGKQVYTGAKAKHQIPTSTGMQAAKDNPGASTAVPTDDNRAPGGTGAKYPAKGVLKTAEFPPKKDDEKGEKKPNPFAKKTEPKDEEAKEESKEKKSGVAALQAVVEKVAAESYGGRHNVSHSINYSGPSEHANEEHGRQKGRQYGAIAGAGLGAAAGGAGAGLATKLLRSPGASEKIREGVKTVGNAISKLGSAKDKALIAGAGLLGAGLGAAPGALVGRGVGGSLGRSVGVMKGPGKEKKSEAVDFILGKLAEYHGGGETLDDKAAPVPSNPGRQLIANNTAPVTAKKVDAKGPVKKQLSEVLSEPALTKSTDSTVQDNLRNAAKGGVKIAAVKDYLRKISEAGCVCAGAGECDYCRMKSSVEKKRADKKVKESLGMPPMGPAPAAGGPVGNSPGMM